MKLPSHCSTKSWLYSIKSALNKQSCFIFLLPTVTRLLDQLTNSALRLGGVEDPSVEVSVSYFVFVEAKTRGNKTIVWYIPTTKAVFKRQPLFLHACTNCFNTRFIQQCFCFFCVCEVARLSLFPDFVCAASSMIWIMCF